MLNRSVLIKNKALNS